MKVLISGVNRTWRDVRLETVGAPADPEAPSDSSDSTGAFCPLPATTLVDGI